MEFHENSFDLVLPIDKLNPQSVLVFVKGDQVECWLNVFEVAYKKADEFCFGYLLID